MNESFPMIKYLNKVDIPSQYTLTFVKIPTYLNIEMVSVYGECLEHHFTIVKIGRKAFKLENLAKLASYASLAIRHY